jgi:hypothetical protein|nr:MAG TPA: hypothetical protein [Crassvirales sp.]
MAKKHDERKDLKCVSKVAEINGNHIIIPTNSLIGIHMWGRIDFLVHYCGYILNRSNNVKASNLKFEDAEVSAREAKKIKKEHKLANKKR